MITREQAKKSLKALMVNASIKQDSQDTSDYLDMLMFFLEQNNITDNQLQKSVMQYIFETEETFNKLPTVGKLVALLGLKQGKTIDDIEKRAQNQAQEVLKASSNYCQYYVFDDPYTNYVLKTVYGDLTGVWKWSTNNPEREDSTWFVKDFVKHYMNAVDFNNFSTAEFAVSNPSPFWEGKKVIGEFTGEIPMLEDKNKNEQVASVIGSIAQNMKV